MNAQARTKPDDTRARIVETADRLFRHFGFAKTSVAEIAAELGMSPANVYRFFPSKNAIVEAICRCCLGELEERVWAVARSRGPAAQRIERLVQEVLAYHKENLTQDQRVNDIVMVALEDSWGVVRVHREIVLNAAELILRDGIEAGEFEAVDPRETALLLMRSFAVFMHPVFIAKCLVDFPDVEAEARRSVQFVLRAITPRS